MIKVQIEQLDAPPPPSAAVAANLTAAPGGQSGALVLAARRNIVTTAGAGTGVKLSVMGDGLQEIWARTGGSFSIYPADGTAIEGHSVNVPVTVTSPAQPRFLWDGTSTWLMG